MSTVTAHISHVPDAADAAEHALSNIWRTIMPQPIHFAAERGDVAALRRELDFAISNYVRLSDPNHPMRAPDAAPGAAAAARRLVPIILRAGAALDRWEDYEDDTWPNTHIQKVIAAGGIKKYERNHLNALAAIFVPKFAHRSLPPEMVRRVVEYAFHVGDY